MLLSDGNENLGNAEEQAASPNRTACRSTSCRWPTGYRNENEVLVQAVEAPPQTEQGARLPIRVLVRSYNPRPVTGTLEAGKRSSEVTKDGETESLVQRLACRCAGANVETPDPAVVQLRPGLNSFSFKQSLAAENGRTPTRPISAARNRVSDDGEVRPGLAGDRVQNNSASTHVVALGQRRVLFVEPGRQNKAGQHRS